MRTMTQQVRDRVGLLLFLIATVGAIITLGVWLGPHPAALTGFVVLALAGLTLGRG